MPVEIIETTSEPDLKKFVKFPFHLYKNNKFWVPPIINDEIKVLLPSCNPAFEHCRAKFWLAAKNGKISGRIGAIINEQFNSKSGLSQGRFTRLEFINDFEVSDALLNTAENWLLQNGVKTVLGPLGFNNLDHQGMLVEGFDHLPSVASEYHLPYYREHLEKAGYEKEIDWIEFRLTLGKAPVDKANRGAELIKKRFGFEVLHFKKIGELLPYTEAIFAILNDAFSDLPFVSPFTPQMIQFYKDKYIKILNPEFVKLVSLKGEPVGFIIGLPSLSEAMQKAKGKLFPFGFLHILRARKGKDVMDQMLTGVKKEVLATGAGVILMAEIQNQMLSKGMKYIETTGIFETNTNAISNWKNYENIQHKRKRCFRKELQ